jgi:plasmid replication initiation protein
MQNTTINTPETLGVTPRYILQHNAISRSKHGMSATAMKLAAMATALLPPDLSSLTAAFRFTDFCKAIGYGDGGKEFHIFKAAVNECLNIEIKVKREIKIDGKEQWEVLKWFEQSVFDSNTGVCTMQFSNELVAFILKLKKVYSRINLLDLGRLQSKYGIRLYEIAVSYSSLKGKDGNHRDTWYFERSIKELRELFEVPESAYKQPKDFRKYVIEKPVEEINNAGLGIKIVTENIKHGNKIVGIRFNCMNVAKTTQSKKTKAASIALPENSVADSTDRLEKELEHLKELYPNEFAELYEKEFAKSHIDGVSEYSTRMMAEWNALMQLKERYGIVK